MAIVPDLAKLRIDRDAPPPAVQRALTRVPWLGAAALAVGAAIVLWALRGALLTLGFSPRRVLASFFAESAVIAILGGIAGGLLALPINGIVTSTTNWNSFSEVAFAFPVTPGLLVGGRIFSVVLGVVGGFFPAWRASRLHVVQALR
jgi:hypothetical protein